MSKTKADSRERLLHAAETTTYHYGFGQAALADIAEEARVPLGNVYYYFKSKDAIGEAIIDLRSARFRLLLEQFDQAHADPRERLCAFVQVKIKKREELARHGCPVGTLCTELQKLGTPAAKHSRVLFDAALDWMETQFQALGRGEESRSLAVHLLSATQGVSVLAHTFHDPAFIDIEARRLQAWLRSL